MSPIEKLPKHDHIRPLPIDERTFHTISNTIKATPPKPQDPPFIVKDKDRNGLYTKKDLKGTQSGTDESVSDYLVLEIEARGAKIVSIGEEHDASADELAKKVGDKLIAKGIPVVKISEIDYRLNKMIRIYDNNKEKLNKICGDLLNEPDKVDGNRYQEILSNLELSDLPISDAYNGDATYAEIIHFVQENRDMMEKGIFSQHNKAYNKFNDEQKFSYLVALNIGLLSEIHKTQQNGRKLVFADDRSVVKGICLSDMAHPGRDVSIANGILSHKYSKYEDPKTVYIFSGGEMHAGDQFNFVHPKEPTAFKILQNEFKGPVLNPNEVFKVLMTSKTHEKSTSKLYKKLEKAAKDCPDYKKMKEKDYASKYEAFDVVVRNDYIKQK